MEDALKIQIMALNDAVIDLTNQNLALRQRIIELSIQKKDQEENGRSAQDIPA